MIYYAGMYMIYFDGMYMIYYDGMYMIFNDGMYIIYFDGMYMIYYDIMSMIYYMLTFLLIKRNIKLYSYFKYEGLNTNSADAILQIKEMERKMITIGNSNKACYYNLLLLTIIVLLL